VTGWILQGGALSAQKSAFLMGVFGGLIIVDYLTFRFSVVLSYVNLLQHFHVTFMKHEDKLGVLLERAFHDAYTAWEHFAMKH